MLTDDKNLIELYQDYIDDEGYVQRYNYDKGRYYNTGICLKGTKGNPGNPGRPGKDGLTPRINQDNGHWMIGDVDTGVTAGGTGGSSDGVLDVSEKFPTSGVEGGNTYTLEGALAVLNANLSASKKKGGMSVKYVQSSDNKYVQYRLMADEFTTDTTQWAIADESVYVENPEFIYVKTDNKNKILWAIRTDGNIFYGAGCPPQVKEYVSAQLGSFNIKDYDDIKTFLGNLIDGDTLATLLNTKIDKEIGKSLIDSDFASSQNVIDNSEYLQVTTDSEDKILEGIKTDGTKVIGLPLEIQGVRQETIDNPEFIQVTEDSEGKVIEATRKDGMKVFPGGIEGLKEEIQSVTNSTIENEFTNKSVTDKFSEEENQLKWNGFPIEADVTELEEKVEANTEDIHTLYGIAFSSDVPPENAIKNVPTLNLYLGEDILDISDVTYNPTYWTIENGLPKYLGGGSQNTTFKFNAATIQNSKYLCEIQTLTEDSAYEVLFYLRIGNGPLVDTYNGSRNTIGGFFSDGGQFEIIPQGTKAFSVTAIALKQCFADDQQVGYVETKTISVKNVDAGNSAATIVDGKWNVAIGPIGDTMANNVGGSRSIAIGYNALKNWFGGVQNIAIGTYAMSLLEEGTRNIAIGSDSLWQAKKAQNNVAIGSSSLAALGVYDEIINNVAIGRSAMSTNKAATRDSVAVGYRCNIYGVPYSVFIGSETTTIQANSNISNVIAIGYFVRPTKSNQCIIGNSSMNEFILGNKKLIFNQDGSVTWESI